MLVHDDAPERPMGPKRLAHDRRGERLPLFRHAVRPADQPWGTGWVANAHDVLAHMLALGAQDGVPIRLLKAHEHVEHLELSARRSAAGKRPGHGRASRVDAPHHDQCRVGEQLHRAVRVLEHTVWVRREVHGYTRRIRRVARSSCRPHLLVCIAEPSETGTAEGVALRKGALGMPLA